MKKKIYLAPDIEVVDVEMETILAGSVQPGTSGSNDAPWVGTEDNNQSTPDVPPVLGGDLPDE